MRMSKVFKKVTAYSNRRKTERVEISNNFICEKCLHNKCFTNDRFIKCCRCKNKVMK
jgi:hypothetical protein